VCILDLGVCAEKKVELTRGLGENVEITLLFESLLMRCPQVLKIEGVKKVCFELILRGAAGADRSQSVESFFVDHAPEFMSSPSWKQVLSGLVAYASKAAGEESFQRAWDKNIRALLVPSFEKERREAAVIQLFKSTPPLLQGKLPFVQELDTYVVNKMRESINTDNTIGWETMRAAMASSGMSSGRHIDIYAHKRRRNSYFRGSSRDNASGTVKQSLS